ncbi:MAG TPA: NADH-ubiquinone oxidoreductase-F iron-sulfur binding region domain-containing protein [Acidimicrobiales bacterium]|nr:NADH-ubiquinone oxidoreductase-F iron-sulfur binding region domain-containing protein [Acidimicrobiales bacterium]
MTAAFLLPDRAVVSIDDYAAAGGGEGLAKAKQIGAAAVIDEVNLSGLRGRGGAGFRTGAKWSSVQRGGGRHHYVVCNGAEGEPGTFKDRALLRANPYAMLEGLAIAAVAVGASEAFVAMKASFERERAAVERALAEAQAAGWFDGVPVRLVAGPEEYLFGEEKALLEVIEGNEPLPRWLPPYLHGLYATAPQLGWQAHEPEGGHRGGHEANPTLVNNVETLANVAHILARGAEWFRTMGTADSPGTVLCTVVGDVASPAVIEVEMGTPLAEVLDRCGAGPAGGPLRAAFSGVSNPVLTADQLATPLSYEAMAAAGSGLGAAGFIVYDDTACMVEVARVLSRFLSVESCGQCPPCKLGSTEITAALGRILDDEAGTADFELIQERLRIVADGNRCYLAVEEQRVVSSILRSFPEDFVDHLEGHCRRRHDIVTPKIVDLENGSVVYDERQERKRPDWTYADAAGEPS